MTSISERLRVSFNTHFEWMALATGLFLMALMDPSVDASSWCLFERLGVYFCPGEGLGHSIAYLFRGELAEAWKAHPVGPLAVAVMGGRIFYLIRNLINSTNS